MKQRLIQFSALLIIFLVSGIGSALAEPSVLPANVTAGNMSVIINYNATDFRPGLDTVNITADFNTSVPGAKISITSSPNLFGASNANLVGASNVNLVGAPLVTEDPIALVAGDPMELIGSNGLGGNSFGYEFPIPEDLSGLLGVDITPLDSEGVKVTPVSCVTVGCLPFQ